MSSHDEDLRRLLPDGVADMTRALKAATDPKRIADFRRQEDERREREAKERAALARIAQLEAFKMVSLRKPLHPYWECPGCGALVVDRERHLDWHGALAATAAEASDAAWRGRPIG